MGLADAEQTRRDLMAQLLGCGDEPFALSPLERHARIFQIIEHVFGLSYELNNFFRTKLFCQCRRGSSSM